jgi:copper chaperone CopZ
MKDLKFKTNINCQNCVKAVSGFINDVEGIESWKVNTDDPNKFLNVKGKAIESAAIIEAVEDAGFDIEWVSAD